MSWLDLTDMLVIGGAIAAIIWVIWYFFFAEQRAVAANVADGGRQDVTIIVRGGYEPSTIRVKAGTPVRLVFDRQETSGCSEEVVFPDFGVRKYLPANEQTVLELTPTRPGTYEFTCGMSMLRGKLIAE